MHKVDTALELVKQVDRKARPFCLPSRLLAITTPFRVESISAGVIPPQWREFPPGGSFETDRIPRLPRCASNKADPNADTLFFTHGEDPASPIVWEPDLDDRNWQAGKGLIFGSSGDETGMRGLGFFGPSMTSDESTRVTLAFFAHANMDRMLRTRPFRLSARQLEALEWAAEGKTDQEIAAILGISEHTVDKYMRLSKEALDAVNRTAAIVRAIRYGLIG